MNELEDRVVFITGAGNGIGRAAAVAAAREGARLMLFDRDAAGLDETAAAIGDSSRVDAFTGDVGREDDVEAAISATLKRHGRLDGALNNAGVFLMRPEITDYSVEEFERILRINVTGVFLCMRAEIRHMRQQGRGVIVNTASASGLRVTPHIIAYAASKHAVIGLTRAAALDYGPRGIRINALCPGLVRTPMLGEMDAGTEEVLRAACPLERLGEADEMADAAIWMLSDRGRFMTGANFVLDGGFSIV
jgi:NAD(P)-dependent dehydrogenase (short-subunit alcohol dehydrogenase family)